MGKQIFLEDIQAEQLCLLDPLARLLLRVTRQNGLYMALIAVVIHSILIIGGGWLISVSYTGQEFRPVYDTRELIYLIFQFIFVVPLLWAFYVLEPIRILQIFQGLAQNEVVGASKSSYANIDEFIHKEVHLINRKANLIVVIIITISLLLLWLTQLYTTHYNNYNFSRPWWFINPLYFWGVWIIEITINVYMVMWIVVRRFSAVSIVNKFLSSFDIDPKIFHPDQSNGLLPIGNYAIKISPLITIVGFWIFFAIAYPTLYGQRLNIKFDTITYIVVYTLFLPVVLILPVWKTHLAMKDAKSQSLETIARQIRTLFAITDFKHLISTESLPLSSMKIQNNFDSERIIALVPLVEWLKEKYRLFDIELHVWPFNTPSIRGFIISTVSPLFWIFVSILIQKYIFP